MFEPGDKVRIRGEEGSKVWTVLRHPYKMWHDQAVNVGDEDGHERAVLTSLLEKVEEPAGEPGFHCNGDFCEIVREEMRME